MGLLALLLLAVVPFAALCYAQAYAPRRTCLFTGIALGSVISPLSLGLYATFFAFPVFGALTGMLGLASTLFHGRAGYQFALWLGVVPPNQVVSGAGYVYIELLNGVFWAVIYGALGFIVDWAVAKWRQGGWSRSF